MVIPPHSGGFRPAGSGRRLGPGRRATLATGAPPGGSFCPGGVSIALGVPSLGVPVAGRSCRWAFLSLGVPVAGKSCRWAFLSTGRSGHWAFHRLVGTADWGNPSIHPSILGRGRSQHRMVDGVFARGDSYAWGSVGFALDELAGEPSWLRMMVPTSFFSDFCGCSFISFLAENVGWRVASLGPGPTAVWLGRQVRRPGLG